MATIKTSNEAWAPNLSVIPAADALPEALILNHSSVLGAIEGDQPSMRVGYVSEGSAVFTAEAATIAESNPTLSEAVVWTGKLAQLAAISREQFEQQQAANQLAMSLSRSLISAADKAFLSQAAPTSPATAPPAGIANVSGLESLGTVQGSLDALIDGIAELEDNGAVPSAIIVSPTAWATLSKMKTASGSNVTLLGAGIEAGSRQILGIPVVVTGKLTGSNGLVIDRSAIVSAVSPLEVAVSEHHLFDADSIAVRGIWRIGWTVVRPSRIGKFVTAEPTP